jgi:predicted alpha/beta superfamily hydrolase
MERLVLPIGRSGQEMEVVVYKPHTYDPAQSYPLLVVADADPLLGLLKTINFLWVEEGKAEPVILVGLPFGSTPNEIWTNRSYYLLPKSVGVIDYYDGQVPLENGGGAPELASFLHEELLPRLLERYSVDRARVGLAGFSMGGLFAAWHLVTHPGVFSDYIIIAPPLAAPFVGPEFEKATQSLWRRGFDRPTRIYVSYAEDDLAYVRYGAAPWSEALDALENANLRFRGEMIGGLRHDSGAIPALANAFEFLYAK